MSDSPKIELHISTDTVDIKAGKYSITFEATNPEGITPDIFVVTRVDDQKNTYRFSRVASFYDIKNLEASSVTEDDSYRVSKFTVESTSLTTLKEYKDNIPKVVQSLLGSSARGLDLDVILGTDKIITITGESE